MSYETLIVETEKRGLARIRLNRPEKHHAINAAMIHEMTAVLQTFKNEDHVRVLLLESTGPNFCSGGDLNWMREQADAARADRIREAQSLANLFGLICQMPKPVIAKVQGNAYGGGVGLVAVADIVVAVDSAKFALTETRLGLIPATIGPFVIRKLGGGAARSVFITGSVMDTARAERLGLVSICAKEDEIDMLTEREIAFALKAAPKAMALAKRLNLEWSGKAMEDQSRIAIEALADCWESEEGKQGIKAFFEKKPAPWINSKSSI